MSSHSASFASISRRTVVAGGCALAVTARARSAAAQRFDRTTIDVAAAKAEGKVSIYTSAPIGAAQKIATAFEAAYGIKVDLFRSGGSEVLRRFMMERQAGLKATDVLVTSDPGAAIELAAKGLFAPFLPEGHDRVPPGVNDPEGRYIAQRISLIANYLRSDLVPVADHPRSWSDLTAPRYKGKLVMTDPSYTSLQLGVTAMLARLHGWAFYEALRQNDILIVKGNEQALGMLKRGERLIVVGGDCQYANEARQQGHKIEIVLPLEGTFAVPAVTAVVEGCQNPHAARLLAAFLLTPEAQSLWPANGIYASRTDTPPPEGAPRISDAKLLAMDFGYIQTQSMAIKKKFADVFS